MPFWKEKAMINSIDDYLDTLKHEMQGFDIATIQDALADSEEHLRTALAAEKENTPDLDETLALQTIIDQYGSPAETAAVYADVERITFPSLSPRAKQKSGSTLGRFFGIYSDPSAWGAMLYMLVSFLTGIVYFSWAVTGLSTSISLALFIFGLPVAMFFLMSVRGIALLEGRLVETLLGVRMPRRSPIVPQAEKWILRLKALVMDKHTWLAMVYMVLQFVLGTVYFILLVTLISLALSGLAIPVLQLVFHIAPVQMGATSYFIPTALLPFTVLAGFLLFTLTLHIAKGIGTLHGKFAKAILVSE
jgi:Putative sensor